jgi:Ser/Thr protein kinase RdoA (MazF antagonist)
MAGLYTSTLANYDLRPPVELFPLGSQGVNNTAVGVRTGDGDFVLKTYQTHADLATIRYEHRLLEWLARAGLSFAVAPPLCTSVGDTLCPSSVGWQALFTRLEGVPDGVPPLVALGACVPPDVRGWAVPRAALADHPQ